MLANWKSMSDVSNMCRYKVDIYQSARPGDKPEKQEQEQEKNRKIKFVLFSPIFILSFMVSFSRKIWHIAGDMTANQHIFVFRNIIM